MFYIGLNCSDGWGGRVVQVYETDGTPFGQFPENSPKIPENCLIFSDESCFWLEIARNAPSNDAKWVCIERAKKATLKEIQNRYSNR